MISIYNKKKGKQSNRKMRKSKSQKRPFKWPINSSFKLKFLKDKPKAKDKQDTERRRTCGWLASREYGVKESGCARPLAKRTWMIVNTAPQFLTPVLGTSPCHCEMYPFSVGLWIFHELVSYSHTNSNPSYSPVPLLATKCDHPEECLKGCVFSL